DKATGFLWRNNGWVPTQFKPEKYLVEKIDIGADLMRSGFCRSEIQGKQRIDGKDVIIDHGCYSVREMGSKSSPVNSHICIEQWNRKSGKLSLESVDCPDFRFAPDGYFHAVEWQSATLDAKADYKDSMQITVGKCSVLHE